jgi:type IV conjugative transfer system protein TraL
MFAYEEHRILHHLDDPLRIFYWTLDEALVLLLSPFIGTAIDCPFLGIAFSIFGTWSLMRLKKIIGGGTLKHAFYWFLPHNKRLYNFTPPSYIKEYIG